ncbi:MAG: hypothetical protein WCG20_03540 [bacterium]
MNKNHDIIEQELHNLSQRITVPSREVFKPIFDRVTNNHLARSPYQMFLDGLLRHKALVLSVATSLAVVMIVIIPAVQPSSDTWLQNETVVTEGNQETFLLEQEDAVVGSVVEQYLGQLEQLGERGI